MPPCQLVAPFTFPSSFLVLAPRRWCSRPCPCPCPLSNAYTQPTLRDGGIYFSFPVLLQAPFSFSMPR